MTHQIFEKDFPSNPEVLPEVEQYVIEIAEKVNLNPDKFNNLALSVSEAASNSVVHGNNSDPNKLLKVKITVTENVMEISLKDQGGGFELSGVPDPTKPENILKDSGRGIHIIKNFVDDLKYNFSPEGTEAILVLNLK
ncbi:MAG: ATP-binding protein [Ignavibacteria bacterium]